MKTLMLFSIMLSMISGNSYKTLWPDNYKAAVGFIEKHRKEIDNTLSKTHNAPKVLLAIIFPELMRYNSFSDFFETRSLEIAYVKHGIDAVDFSIGHFQMKPSFAVKIEKDIYNSMSLSARYTDLCIAPDINLTKRRKIRIERLQKVRWQLRYLCAYYDIMLLRFPELKKHEQTYQVAFLAAAYNLGYKASKKSILEWMQTPAFPDGKNANTKQFAYASIAVDFYKNYKLNTN